MASTGDDLLDMAAECGRQNVKIERLERERDKARDYADHWHIEAGKSAQEVQNLQIALAAARAELKRLQESDPHRIAMVLQEALDEKREEWQERSRDGALALEEVSGQLDAARAEVEGLKVLVHELWGDLTDYGQHQRHCLDQGPGHPCKCGLMQALQTWPQRIEAALEGRNG